MRRLLIAAAFVMLWAGTASAQIDIKLPGGGTGSGDCDPSQWSDPAGTGSFGGSTGACTYSANLTIVPLYSLSTGSNPATCTQGGMWNLRTDSDLLNFCRVSNGWIGVVTGDPTDDRVPVGNGTKWETKAVPDCDDSTGQHLNYDTTTNAFSCGTSGGSSTFDPGTAVSIYEDFVSSGETASGRIGATGVSFTAISTGTISVTVAGSAGHPGLMRLNSHASNDNSGVSAGWFTGSVQEWGAWDGVEWTYDAVVLFGSNSTAITNTALHVGLTNASSSEWSANASAGIWIRHDSDASDSTFVFVVCNASGAAGCAAAGDDTNAKTVASTITPSAGNYYRFRMRRVASGVGGNPTIYMRVNNETEKTFCSSGCNDTLGTLSTGALWPGVQYITRTTTGVMSSDIDYLAVSQTGLTRY